MDSKNAIENCLKYFRDEKGEPRELSDLETYYSSLLEQAKKTLTKRLKKERFILKS